MPTDLNAKGLFSYGQKLIAEAIVSHFGEREEAAKGSDGDTTNRDVWEAFDALSALPPCDGVKELEWSETTETWRDSKDEYREKPAADFWDARPPHLISYQIMRMTDERFAKPGEKYRLQMGRQEICFDTLEAAKAAAQSDYARRIRSALTAVPADEDAAKAGAVPVAGEAVAAEIQIAWKALERIAARADPTKLSPIQYEAAEAAAKIARSALDIRGEIRTVDFPSDRFPPLPNRYASPVPAAVERGTIPQEPLAWVDIRLEPASSWEKRLVAVNPEYVKNNGPENFLPLYTRAQILSEIASTPALSIDGETEAARDVLAERRRQVEVEDFDASHDDMATRGQMAGAAACYALTGASHWAREQAIKMFWPWDQSWWKPTTVRRNLVKAGALILAEIERFDRLSSHPQTDEAKEPK